MTATTKLRHLPKRLRRATHGRLYGHAALFLLVTALLLIAGVGGYLSLRGAAEAEYAKATKAYQQKLAASEASALTPPDRADAWEEALATARNKTITRNFKKLSTEDKIKYTLQTNYLPLFVVGIFALALTACLVRVCVRRDESRREKVSGYLEAFDFLLPFLFGLALFTVYPIVNVVLLSFQEKHNFVFNTFSGYGLGNYTKVLGDKRFSNALKNTAQYVAFTVPISTCLALLIANLLNRKLRCSALFQTAYFLPMVTAATATGLAWKFMFQGEYGLINYVLSLFGVSPIQWLTNSQYNIWALIIYGVWNLLPFTIILLLSGLQNIDGTYYTAARVDGAKGTRIFFRITVPLLAPTISLVLIINSISCAKVFNEIFPLFNGKPGVAENLYTMVYYIYNYAFNAGGSIDMGRAAAAAILLFFILFAFTMAQLFIQRKWQYH